MKIEVSKTKIYVEAETQSEEQYIAQIMQGKTWLLTHLAIVFNRIKIFYPAWGPAGPGSLLKPELTGLGLDDGKYPESFWNIMWIDPKSRDEAHHLQVMGPFDDGTYTAILMRGDGEGGDQVTFQLDDQKFEKVFTRPETKPGYWEHNFLP